MGPDEAPIDPDYPGRWYLPPKRDEDWVSDPDAVAGVDYAYTYAMDYHLPEMTCEHCVLQWHYVTANSCKPTG